MADDHINGQVTTDMDKECETSPLDDDSACENFMNGQVIKLIAYTDLGILFSCLFIFDREEMENKF